MRGSSMPQISSGYRSPSGTSVGSLSICQSSTPFTERAAHRCESPRRSSTRQSSRVEPSGKSVAPALNTLLMEYGQSFPVKIGLPPCRSNSVSYWFILGFVGIVITFIEEGSCNFDSFLRPLHLASDLFSRTVVFFYVTHFQKRHQERQRGFRSLIFVGSVRMQSVSATACSGIVQRDLKIVVSKEPIERGPRLFAPAALPSCLIGLQARRNRRARLHRLLIEAGLLRCLGIKALRTNGHKVALYLASLKRHQPVQRLKSRRQHLFVPRAYSRTHQCLWQSCIRIGKPIFKPLPIFSSVDTVGTQQSVGQRVRSTQRRAIPRERVEIFLHSQQRKSAGARALKLDSRRHCKFKHAARRSA